MDLQSYIDEIKLALTGGILKLELPDTTLAQVVNKSLRTVQRYIDTPKLITVPYARCIDMADFKTSAVTKIYRAEGYLDAGNSTTSGTSDPFYAQQWQIFSNGGTLYNLSSYVANYASYNTLLQMRNTTSTDLSFRYDKADNKLYINCAHDYPDYITIEYIPIFESVEEVTSDYWIDIIAKLSIAQTKIILGRIRSRYTQSNALWTQDGETLLNEGNAEMQALTEMLDTNAQLSYSID